MRAGRGPSGYAPAMPTEPRYPPPPWTMHGEAYFAAYRVRTSDLTLPAGMKVAHPGPHTVGLLGYVRYEPPSPLCYDELIWMPCFVRAEEFGPAAKGWFVSIMYVNQLDTLAGGREIWKIPKTLARFERGDGTLAVNADDGTEMRLRFGRIGPGIPGVRGRMTTLQWNDGRSLCRFGARATATAGAGRLSVDSFRSDYAGWMGFDPSARLPAAAVAQKPFVSEMQIPTFVTRR